MSDCKPSAWLESLEQYQDAWGSAPDFDNKTDQGLFLSILEQQVRGRIEADLAESFRGATERLRNLVPAA